MSTTRIGNVEIQAIQDCSILMNPHQFMPDHADQFMQEFGHQADERGLLPMSVTCFLIRSGGRNVLVDTGLGPRRRPGFPQGKLDQALKAAGVDRADIDLIVNTHLHVDHTGWNTVDKPGGGVEFFFPKARWKVQRVEWDYWMQSRFLDDPGQPHLKETVEPLRHSGRLDFAYMEDAIDENLHFVASPGHTPGHVCIGIASGGERAIIVGDASHHPVQLTHPDWSPTFDADPTLSAKTRDRLFDEAVADGRTFLAGHWPFPGMGRILRVEGKRTFRAL